MTNLDNLFLNWKVYYITFLSFKYIRKKLIYNVKDSYATMCIFFIQFPEKSLQKSFVSKMKVVFIFFNKLMRQEAAGFRMRAAYQEQGGMIRYLRFSPTSQPPNHQK